MPVIVLPFLSHSNVIGLAPFEETHETLIKGISMSAIGGNENGIIFGEPEILQIVKMIIIKGIKYLLWLYALLVF
jgi:hypothetical protein